MSDETKPAGKPFVPGQSGNPGGRPKGLERLVRETVGDDIVTMTKAQVAIALGRKPEGCDHLPAIKPSDMTKAYEAVVDRGWGKARQTVDVTGDIAGSRIELPPLSEEDLAVLAKLDQGNDDPAAGR